MYALSSYAIPKEIMKAVADGKRTNLQSIQDTPNNGDYKILKIGKENYCIYEKGGKYYVEQPYQFIREITGEVYKDAVKFANPSKANEAEAPSEINEH